MDMALTGKMDLLKGILNEVGSVLVAYSGGVDSTLLLKVARQTLGDRAVAATACSETYPSREIEAAKDLAKTIGGRHLVLDTDELADERFVANPPERCYYCKSELWDKLTDMARELGLATVVDGANADDVHDFRPGARAGREHGIRSPLKEAGFSKSDIRAAAKELGLPNWDKPSLACLSSRFPYGERITQEKLSQIHEAETYIMGLGIRQLRVRHHGDIARVEVAPEDFARLLEHREGVASFLKGLGFAYVALDLQGYRTGSMNEVLSHETKVSQS